MGSLHNSTRCGKPDNNRRRGVAVHGVFREFAGATSMHGVPRIINAQSFTARIFWSIICMAAFGMFFWQTAILLQRYYSYPKKVNVEIVQRPVRFPWVSVCNTKHLDILTVDKLEKMFFTPDNVSHPDDPDFLKDFQDRYEVFWEFSSYYFQKYQMLNISFDKTREDMLEVYSRLGLIANLGTDMASKGGIALKDFIVSCTFMDEKCNTTKALAKFFDPYYFNCFTFKPEHVDRSQNNRLQGIEFGLSLLLFTGSAGQLTQSSSFDFLIPGVEESDSALASGRGARVVIHSPDTVPHPTHEGFDIAPGFSVTIGVKARENSRISPPHGNCSSSDSNEEFLYTLIGCQNDCLQNSIIKRCGCIDNRISVRKKQNAAYPYCVELPKLEPQCLLDLTTDTCNDKITKWSQRLNCRKEVYENLTLKDPDAIDRCNCYPPCNDIEYDSYYSLSTIPEKTEEHTAFYTTITDFLEQMPSRKKEVLLQKFGKDYLDAMSDHISRLNVHIADSNVIKTTEAPDYEAIRLISDIGGQLGLWIGISVMTLFEVVQLFADVCRFITSRGRTVGERRLDKVAERDVEMQCEVDRLTAV